MIKIEKIILMFSFVCFFQNKPLDTLEIEMRKSKLSGILYDSDEDTSVCYQPGPKVIIFCKKSENIRFALQHVMPVLRIIDDINKINIEIISEDEDLIEDNSALDVIYAAAIAKDEYKLKKFIKLGADINIKDDEGRTSLMRAALKKQHNVVFTLLNFEADFRIKDKYGKDFFDYIDAEKEFFEQVRDIKLTHNKLAQIYNEYFCEFKDSDYIEISSINYQSSIPLFKDDQTKEKSFFCKYLCSIL